MMVYGSCLLTLHGLSLFQPSCLYFVCVEVLRPSQPNGVMLNEISLPNHTFYWAGLVLKAVNQYCAHFFAGIMSVT